MGVETNVSLPSQPPIKGGESPARPTKTPLHSTMQGPVKEVDSGRPIAKVPEIDLEKLRENLEHLEKKMDRKLSFSIDETIDRVVIIVKNNETGEEIRKLPDEATLNVAHSIENLKGLLFDDAF